MNNPYTTEDILRPSEWAERAACKGKPFMLFEYQEKDSPLCTNMSQKVRVAFNDSNFEKAGEICIECPVFFECRANATELDKYWTVRGGEPPGRFAIEAEQMSKLGRPSASPTGPRTCNRGHFIPNGGRCMTCKNITRQARRDEARATTGSARGVS